VTSPTVTFRLVSFVIALGFLLACDRHGAQTEAQPFGAARNVVVVSLCSVRADHMSLYGYARATTPALAAFADDAWVFEHAVTQWPKTVPAFSALLTGRYGHSHGVMRVTPGQHLDDRETTLAEVLAERGFDTAAFVSSGVLHAGTNVFQQGFARVEETFRNDHPFEETTRRAIEWIGAREEKPFLAWVHYNNAHYPYVAPGASPDVFVDDAVYDPKPRVKIQSGPQFTVSVPETHANYRQIMRPDVGGIAANVVLAERPNELAFYVARYDAGILGADRTIAPLLEALRELGRLDDTVIAVVGDHGESLGDHDYYFQHGRFPYDDNMRVPLVIRPPGGVAGRAVREPVATFRLAPTILDLLGIEAPAEMEATSLLPRLRGEEAFQPVFSESGYQYDYQLAVRDERWKLIFVPNEFDQATMRGRTFELYDLVADPRELEDLSESRPDVVSALAGTLRDWSQPWVRQAYARMSDAHAIDEEVRERLTVLGYLD
jgi:arylsulfatase A-like enzyme